MNKLKTFKIRFNDNGILSMAVVIEETLNKALNLLINDYKEYGLTISIEDYEEFTEKLTEKGILLTCHEPI